jgi:hypothetical protein
MRNCPEGARASTKWSNAGSLDKLREFSKQSQHSHSAALDPRNRCSDGAIGNGRDAPRRPACARPWSGSLDARFPGRLGHGSWRTLGCMVEAESLDARFPGRLGHGSWRARAAYEKPRETCVLMTEVSAFLGVRARAGLRRNVSTSRGVVSTTFQSCQSLAIDAVSASVRLSSGKCRLIMILRWSSVMLG